MLFWFIYFSAVVYWHLMQAINANAFLNLGLGILLFFPIPKKTPHAKLLGRLRKIIGYPLGIILLWHESYLPPIQVIWNFLARPDLRPSTKFLLDFLISHLELRFFFVVLTAAAIGAVLTYTKLKKYILFFFGLCVVILFFTQRAAVSKDFTDRFFSLEANSSTVITANSQNDFDIIILQICSLSWADLKYAKVDAKDFFNHFDYVFTNFNSATPYSDPAALRLLQSDCGQKTEGEIFAAVPEKCYLLNNLRNLGYSTYSAWNHDGTYSNFTNIVKQFGKADEPISLASLKPTETSFDNSPIYRDQEVLDTWLKQREPIKNKTALFYNSITLHTGSTYLGGQKLSEKDEYHLASQNFFQDLDEFFQKVKQSKRNTIVILLGEHGAALEGSSFQSATVRDIPLPQITQVPAAVKIFGPGFNNQTSQTVTIDTPTSYHALITFLSDLLNANPKNPSQLPSKQTTKNLPKTDLVSESESSLVFQDGSGVFYRSKKEKNWHQLPSSFIVGPTDYLTSN